MDFNDFVRKVLELKSNGEEEVILKTSLVLNLCQRIQELEEENMKGFEKYIKSMLEKTYVKEGENLEEKYKEIKGNNKPM